MDDVNNDSKPVDDSPTAIHGFILGQEKVYFEVSFCPHCHIVSRYL